MTQLANVTTLSEAKHLLAELREYENLTAKLGRRGKEYFYRKMQGTHDCRVEYHPSLGRDEAENQANTLFPRVFSHNPNDGEIVYTENPTLGGGMKLFYDDLLLDMSFACVEKKFKK